MQLFNGSGFAMEIPGGVQDTSNYSFLLPENQGFAASLMIRFQPVYDGFNFNDHVEKEYKSVSSSLESFKLLNKAQGKRGGCDGAIVAYEWGSGATRLKQKQIFLLTAKTPAQLYTITTTDLVANASASDPIFDQMLGTFNVTAE